MTQRRRFLLRLAARGPGRRASGEAARGSDPADSTARETPRVRHTSALRGLLGAATFALAAAAGALALLATAPPAHAAPFVDVTYDLSDSTAVSSIPLLDATSSTPPSGTLSGTQTLRYTSDSAGNIVPGPVDLISFNLTVESVAVTVTNYTGTLTINTSDVHFEFLSLTNAAATGQLSGGSVDPLGANGVFRVTGNLHCFDYCGLVRVYPSQEVGIRPDTFTAPLPRLLTGTYGGLHTFTGTATGVTFYVKPYSVGLGQPNAISAQGTTFLVGREIQRTQVPEPSTLPMLAGGLAALGLAGAAWRRRIRG